MPFINKKRKRVQLLPPSDEVAKEQQQFATQQQFKDDCDINFIVRRNIQFPPAGQMIYGDVSQVMDYQEFIGEFLPAVKESFNSLPEAARKELQNDPRNLLDANKAFFERHGLLAEKSAPSDSQELLNAVKENTEALKTSYKKKKSDAERSEAGDS